MRMRVNYRFEVSSCNQLTKSPAHKCRALAFGIDRNQESFFLRIKTPTDAARVAVNCKKFLCLVSLGL
jgi:hypothetical protein